MDQNPVAAYFTVAARGQFLVTASWANGKPEFVEVLSQGGQPCRIRNPWPAAQSVTVHRDDRPWKTLGEAMLAFDTEPNCRYLLVPSTVTVENLRRVVP